MNAASEQNWQEASPKTEGERKWNRDVWSPATVFAYDSVSLKKLKEQTLPARTEFFLWDRQANELKRKHQRDASWFFYAAIVILSISFLISLWLGIGVLSLGYILIRRLRPFKDDWIRVRISTEITRAWLGVQTARWMLGRAALVEVSDLDRDWDALKVTLVDGSQEKDAFRTNPKIFDHAVGLHALKSELERNRGRLSATPEFLQAAQFYYEHRPTVQIAYLNNGLEEAQRRVAVRTAYGKVIFFGSLGFGVLALICSWKPELWEVSGTYLTSTSIAGLKEHSGEVLKKIAMFGLAWSGLMRMRLNATGAKANIVRNVEYLKKWEGLTSKWDQAGRTSLNTSAELEAWVELAIEGETLGLQEHHRFVLDMDAAEHQF
ncbi:MAG: hypothetical protein JNM85_00230 [Chthonomonas sp.]|nr:hypothetical protein [Chthonomonas sp.]